MPDELKPCPMCGHIEIRIVLLVKMTMTVKCMYCGLNYRKNFFNSTKEECEYELIRLWNSRPHQTVAGDEVEELALKIWQQDFYTHKSMPMPVCKILATKLIEAGYRQQGKLAEQKLCHLCHKPSITMQDGKNVCLGHVAFEWPSMPTNQKGTL